MPGTYAPLVRPIPVEQTYGLRRRVLRPQQACSSVPFAGDDAPGALHLGAFDTSGLLAIASLIPERAPGGATPGDWRLRGMATAPDRRRRGLGNALVRAAFEHVAAAGGVALWCNARTTAEPFYGALGFLRQGAPFDLPEIGPHVRMWRPI